MISTLKIQFRKEPFRIFTQLLRARLNDIYLMEDEIIIDKIKDA